MANFEGFQEALLSVAPIIKDMATSYAKKEKGTDNLTWLAGEILQRTTGASAESAKQTGSEILSAIDTFSSHMDSIRKSCSAGKSKETWLADFLASNSGEDMQKAGDYFWQVQS